MTKMTYGEQLKHPNWQRKRLEMLESADWRCARCESADTTLHVHHKQYFKGRMAWEYSADELEVLCEPCHAGEHASEETLKRLLAATGTATNAGVIAGFHHADDWLDPADLEAARQDDALAYAAGFVAYLTYALCDVTLMLKVAEYAAGLATAGAESRMVFTHSRRNAFGEKQGGVGDKEG